MILKVKYGKFRLTLLVLSLIILSVFTVIRSDSNAIKSSNLKIENINHTEESSSGFAAIIDKVSPGVVTVSINSIVNSYKGINQVTGIGTGFFIGPTKILTNQHVVLNSSNVNVILSDGTKLDAKVVNTDQINDIALLEVTTPGFESKTVLNMGTSKDMRVGDWVIAIGSPLDLSFSGSATIGIISGLSRTIDTGRGVSTFIQTDAAINPGNSGGPLLNLRGEVIGINTAKIDVDGVESIGFSIPIEMAKFKLEELSKYVLMLGISGVDISEQVADKFGISKGVFIVEVGRDSICYNMGISPGDIVVRFNGEEIDSIDDINEMKKSIGNQLSIDVVRNGRIINFKSKVNE